MGTGRGLVAVAAVVGCLMLSGCAGRSGNCTSAPPQDGSDPAVAEALAVAMPADEFWALIEVIGAPAQRDYDALVDALAARPVDDLVAFDARLTLALHALDDECTHLAYTDADPWEMEYVSDDVFLYARAETVGRGRDAWSSVLAGEPVPTDEEMFDGESLLFVALEASLLQGMGETSLWDLESERFSLSYETGSNTAGWPAPESTPGGLSDEE